MLQINRGGIVRKTLAVSGQHILLDFKPQEREACFLQESSDLVQSQAQFLGMEQQIAAGADAEKIGVGGGDAQIVAGAYLQQFLASAADRIGADAVAARRDQLPRADNVAPGDLAIEANQHKAAGLEQQE